MDRKFLALVTLAFAALLSGCKNDGGDLAVVDNDKITMEEFNKYLAIKNRVRIQINGQSLTAPVQPSLGFQAMEDLIRDRVVRHIAQDEGVYPTDRDVQAEIDFQKKRDPNFLRSANASGMDLNTIKSQLTLELATTRIITKGIKVSADEVSKYITEHPALFKEPEQVELYWILVATDAQKNQVDQDLLSGQKFPTVALRYSQAPGARSQQGRYPESRVPMLPALVQKVVKKTPELNYSDWVSVQGGFAKWYVEKRTAARKIEIDDTTREVVRRKIAYDRGVIANDLDKRIREKLLASKVDVRKDYYSNLWKDEVANLQNMPQAPGTAPTAGPEAVPIAGN